MSTVYGQKPPRDAAAADPSDSPSSHITHAGMEYDHVYALVTALSPIQASRQFPILLFLDIEGSRQALP